jgi:hypothetical protein
MERGVTYPTILALGALAEVYGVKTYRMIRFVVLTNEMAGNE